MGEKDQVMKKVTIVGAGLVGSLQAVFMARRGYEVNVYERRPDLRKAVLDAGRSINLVISHRGWTALKSAGIADEIEKITVAVYGRMTHDVEGNTNYYPYSVMGKPIHSVSRGELNARLMDCAEAFDNVRIHFEMKCEGVDLDTGECVFEDVNGQRIAVQGDLVIGTDGASSAVRHAMEGTPGFESKLEFIEHGYKEIHIPPNEDGTPQMRLDALHIWPRRSFMLMGLANLDGGFTGTLFFPMEGEPWSFDKVRTREEAAHFFQTEFPDAVPMIPDLLDQYADNPTSKLGIVRCNPWHHSDKVLLMGDAAHAIIPFYGEGMNCGFEDCQTLENLLDEHGDEDMGAVLATYSALRKPNGDAIADLSVRNFVEMRDLVADPEFILRKKIEGNIYRKHPEKWIPLYSQVKFTNIPYAEAQAEGDRQDEIMKMVLALDDIESKWDSEEVEQMIMDQL